MKLKTKLTSAFLLLAVLVIIVSAINIYTGRTTVDSFDKVTKEFAPSVIALQKVKKAALRMMAESVSTALLLAESDYLPEGYQLVDDDDDEESDEENAGEKADENTEESDKYIFSEAVDEEIEEFEESNDKLLEWLEDYLNIRINATRSGYFKRIKEAFGEFSIAGKNLMIIKKNGVKGEKILLEKEKFEEAEDELLSIIDEALNYEFNELNSGRKQAELNVDNSLYISVAVMILGVITAIFLGLIISGRIANPIVKLKDAALRVGEGDFTQNVKVKTIDEVGNLADSFNSMVQQLNQTTVSKAYVETIIETLVDSLIVLNNEAKIEKINQATCDLLGYEKDEILGKSIDLVLSEDTNTKIVLEKLFEESYISRAVEKTYLGKDGKKIPVLFSGAVMIDDDGNKAGVVCSAQDITLLKKAEEDIQKAKERFEFLFSSSPDIIYNCSTDGQNIKLKFISNNIEEKFGFSVKECLGDPEWWSSRIHPEDKERAIKELAAVFETGYNTYEYRFRFKDGNYRWLYDSMKLIYDADGKPSEIIGTWIDITKRKETEKELQDSHDTLELRVKERTAELEEANIRLQAEISERIQIEKEQQKFAALIENSSDFIGIADLRGKPIYLNTAGSKLIGIENLNELNHISDVIFDEDLEFFESNVVPVNLKTGNWRGKVRFKNQKTGEGIPVEINGFTIKDKNTGHPIALATVSRDNREQQKWEEKLKQSEQDYRGLYEGAHDAIIIFKPEGEIVLDANQHACDMYGFDRSEFIGMSLEEVSENVEVGREHLKKTLEKGFHYTFETIHRKKDGSRIDVDVSASVVEFRNQEAIQSINRDISDRKEIERLLRVNEERYRTLAEAAPISIYLVSKSMNVEYVNEYGSKLLGASAKDITGKNITQLFPGKTAQKQILTLKSVFNNGSSYRSESIVSFPGTKRWIDTQLIPLFSENGEVYAILGLSHDITERKKAEEAIIDSLHEKEILLKEIHHRVKNNMQIISSMLSLQSGKIKDETYLQHFKDSENRIKSMALIHEKLYQTENLTKINFADLVPELTQSLFASAGASNYIRLNLNVDDILLNIDTAVPCSLIINELVSNCLKHAFPQNLSGEIGVELNENKNGKSDKDKISSNGNFQYSLSVWDNGVGLPKDLDIKNTKSLGLKLIYSLTKQLKGEIEFCKDNGGAKVKIEFNQIDKSSMKKQVQA